MKAQTVIFSAAIATLACVILIAGESDSKQSDESKFLSSTRQLTFAGKRSGEGYFSSDGSQMIFQSERESGNPFYQIYLMDLETGDTNRVSPGFGKTTCAWIHPGGERILFASSHADPKAKEKQAIEIEERKSRRIRKYSWDYDENYEIWQTSIDGSNPKNLTNSRGYDAEGSYSPDGKWIAFASNRQAYAKPLNKEQEERLKIDKSYFMEIYLMKSDGTGLKRLTNVPGYDGGPFFSPDGKKVCWRRFSEKGDTAEIFTMDLESGEEKQLTSIGALSWAPYFHPSGKYLIFATNKHGFANFELYLVDSEGNKEPVRVTHTEGFDGLASFRPDGKVLSWTSNRTAQKQSQIFVSAWNHETALEALTKSASKASPEIKTKTDPKITAKDIKQHIEYLASEKLQGRLTGTEGEKLATKYVADYFKSLGLEPGGDRGSFFQEFEFTAGIDLGEENALIFSPENKIKSALKINEDWRPLSFTKIGKIENSEIVFAGYGLEVPEGKAENGKKLELYSSYFHLDVKDKWVMVFRYMPENLTEEQRRRFSRYSHPRYKTMIARQKGARGIIIVSGPNAKVKSQLIPLGTDASMSDSGMACVSITDKVAQEILKSANVKESLKEIQSSLDSGKMRSGIALKGIQIDAQLSIIQEKRKGRNVIGVIPAKDPHAPAVLIGAHVDHLGPEIGSGSRASGKEKSTIHYGADDNASGTAGLMEIAEYLADLNNKGKLPIKRSAIFAAWSGEELGLLGSSHYVRANAKMFFADEDAKLDKLFAAALNMDMIGRFKNKLVLQGVGSSSRWPAEIEKRNAPIGLPITTQTDSYLATDATSFYLRGIPILNAFTGAHEDYHTPLDTVDKINFEGASKVTKFMALLTRGLITSADRPDYVAMAKPEEKGTRGGMRTYLGTIPDYSQGDIVGVKLSGVTKGAPADKAGIKGGDIIVSLSGKELKNIYDYTYVLGALKVGTETEIKVKRKGKVISLKIVPGSRD
ncbi:M28 family peptidase [Verrucomicrobia bacterium]|nr:M28 family peptidase [Verrucomicrobiota bacterium]